MIHLKKRLAFGLAAGLLAACITVPVYGASRKKITSISLTIKADIEADTDYGDETKGLDGRRIRFRKSGLCLLPMTIIILHLLERIRLP